MNEHCKQSTGSLTRRSFIKGSACAVIAACYLCSGDQEMVVMEAHEADVYVCPPCGLDCDKLTFDKPGTCPACGMILIEKGERDRLDALAVEAGKSPLAGSWAGTYFIGSSEHTAVQINFTGTPQGLKGTVDL